MGRRAGNPQPATPASGILGNAHRCFAGGPPRGKPSSRPKISRQWAGHPADPATKFCILAKDAAENDTLLFDEANLLARAIGVALEKSDAAIRRIAAFNGDKVTLLSARNLLAARNIGEDIAPNATLYTSTPP